MRERVIIPFVLTALAAGCGSREIRPVEVYPEDMCTHCRMAISDQRFGGELITAGGEVYKFDDIGCLESFRKERPDVAPAAVYVRDYESKSWLGVARATIVRTGVATPMGSGMVAFPDSSKARAFAAGHPVLAGGTETGGCGCCGREG